MFVLAAMAFQTLMKFVAETPLGIPNDANRGGFPRGILGLEFPKFWALIQSSQCVQNPTASH